VISGWSEGALICPDLGDFFVVFVKGPADPSEKEAKMYAKKDYSIFVVQ